jgi:hypothetical protein
LGVKKKELKKLAKTEKESEIESVSLRDLRDNDVLNVIGIAKTTREFTVTNAKAEDYGDKKTVDVIVLLAKMNGKTVYLPLNFGTTAYRQMEKFIEDEQLSLPVKLCDYTFHIASGKNSSGNRYILFSELQTMNDYSKLFE